MIFSIWICLREILSFEVEFKQTCTFKQGEKVNTYEIYHEKQFWNKFELRNPITMYQLLDVLLNFWTWWKLYHGLLFFCHRSFMRKIIHEAVINIVKQCISNDLTWRFVCCNIHIKKYTLFLEKNYLNVIEIARDKGVT